jgi:hypothetical protein
VREEHTILSIVEINMSQPNRVTPEVALDNASLSARAAGKPFRTTDIRANLAALGAVSSLFSQSEKFQNRVIDLAGAATALTSMMYPLTFEISPGYFWMDGLAFVLQTTSDVTQITATVKALNKSDSPLSGTVRCYLNNGPVRTFAPSVSISGLAPGQIWKANFKLSIQGQGIHTLTAELLGDVPTGEFVNFDPFSGTFAPEKMYPTLSIEKQTIIIGNHDTLRSLMAQRLGITVGGAIDGEYWYASAIDGNGIRRNITLTRGYGHEDTYSTPGKVYGTEFGVETKIVYSEEGHPENFLLLKSTSVFVAYAVDGEWRFSEPNLRISVEGPAVDEQNKKGLYFANPSNAGDQFTELPIEWAPYLTPPYTLGPGKQHVRMQLLIKSAMTSSHDGIVLSAYLRRYVYMNDPGAWGAPWPVGAAFDLGTEALPTIEYPVTSTTIAKGYRLTDYFGWILGRIAFFFPVLIDQPPQVPAELAQLALASKAKSIAGNVLTMTTAPPVNLQPSKADWVSIVLLAVESLSLRAACVAITPEAPPISALCLLGTALWSLDVYLTKKVHDVMEQQPSSGPPTSGGQGGSSGGTTGGGGGGPDVWWPPPMDPIVDY